MLKLASLFLIFLLALPAFAQDWVEVKSAHFSVVTDAGEKRGREVALRFEQMRSAFARIFRAAKVNVAVPLPGSKVKLVGSIPVPAKSV